MNLIDIPEYKIYIIYNEIYNMGKKIHLPNFKNIISNLKRTASTDFNNLKNQCNQNTSNFVELNQKFEKLNKDYKNKEQELNQKFEELNKDYKNKEQELKLKNTQYNNLLKKYNIQLKDKQGVMDYLTVSEHFSNIEGLSEIERNAIIELTGNLDYNYYNSIATQNKQIDLQTQNNKNNYSTDDQRVYYKTIQVNFLNTMYNYLFILYYVFFVILCYFVYYSKTTSLYMKIAIVLITLFYPYFILMLERNMYKVYKIIYSVITGIPYAKN